MFLHNKENILSRSIYSAALGFASIAAISTPLPSQAEATAAVNSNITVTSTFPIALGPHNWTPFSLRDPDHFDSGFHVGNAGDSHSSGITNQGGLVFGPPPFPPIAYVATTGTDLNLEVWADYPGGYASARGYAKQGFTIDLDQAGLVTFDITPATNVFAKTQTGGEYAWANFKYNVSWNGETIDALLADVHFYSANGRCQSPGGCEYNAGPPFRAVLPGVVGRNTFYIDPESEPEALAVPAPLPLLGMGVAFRAARKARRLSHRTRQKPFSIG